MAHSFRHRLLTSSLLIGAAALAQSAHAQTATAQGTTVGDSTNAPPAVGAPPETLPAAGTGQEIVVTGSLIKNPNLSRSTPVASVSAAEIQLRQANVAEEVLRDIPGVVPDVGSQVNNGNNGNSLVDLRGLGSNRNLVLLDGSRLVPATLTGEVDLDDIPIALVDRVDVLTGGASQTYGADAVAGVVNFITKKNFSGLQVDATSAVTGRGDGFTRRFEATTGANLDDGRGNAVLSLGYQKADPVFQGDRGFSQESLDSTDPDNLALRGSPTATPSTFSIGGKSLQIGPNGNLVAPYAPYNFAPLNLFQVPFKRYNIYGAAHYDITDHITAYTRGLFSKTDISTIVAPSGIFNQPVTFPLSNPYLTDSIRNSICTGLNIADCSATNNQQVTVNVRRRTPEVGNRTDNYTTTVFDYQAGLRGDITDKIQWDIHGSYGESDRDHTTDGYVNVQKARDALLATNTTTCLSGNTGCVPLNIFGPAGSITPEQAAYLNASSFAKVHTTLAQAQGSIHGELPLTSPAANQPLNFAVGAEYRVYTAAQTADSVAQDPGALGGAGAATLPFSGSYDVYEFFGEMIAPVVQDKPFFHDLTINGGIRYSKYEVHNTPNRYNTTVYQGGGSWEPVEGFKFRGNYSHSVRAPNLYELFQPPVTTLTNFATDPCAGSAPTTNANLRAVCLAQGAPAAAIGNIQNPAAGQPNATTSGNINLKPEKANTYTLGLVLSPKMDWARGITLTVDYYHIKVKDAITTPTPDDVINGCFGNVTAASATDPACTAIRRDPATGGLDGDPATTAGLAEPLSNLGTIYTNGIDLSAAYNHRFGKFRVGLTWDGNYTFHSQFMATPTSINRECIGYFSTNCSNISKSPQPQFTFNQRSTIGLGPVDVSLLWRHISSLDLEPVVADQFDPRFDHIKTFNYFDLSARFAAKDNVTFVVSALNLTDKKPPIIGSTIGNTAFDSGNTFPSTYDPLGRRYSVTAQFKF